MTNPSPGPDWFLPYWQAFRKHAFQLVMCGYNDALAKIRSKRDGKEREEEEITGFITEAIQERLRSQTCPTWCGHYSLKEDNPVPTEGKTGKRRRRTDIIVELTQRGRPEFIFESKRLLGGKSKEDKYISDGLHRFMSGSYGSRYPEAGMLGYVQSDSLEHWAGRIRGSIDNDLGGKCRLNLRNTQRDVNAPLEPGSRAWVSEHTRNNGRSIAIYHILLDSICNER